VDRKLLFFFLLFFPPNLGSNWPWCVKGQIGVHEG
jgi:hypothetical protein